MNRITIHIKFYTSRYKDDVSGKVFIKRRVYTINMVAPIVTQDQLITGITTTSGYVYQDPVQVYDADSFSILIAGEANPGSNTIDYKVQVSADLVSPTNWSDWIAETILANDASFAQSYPEEAWRWVRIGLQWNTAGEDVTIAISTRREKVI